jgi:hypothetical protein
MFFTGQPAKSGNMKVDIGGHKAKRSVSGSESIRL